MALLERKTKKTYQNTTIGLTPEGHPIVTIKNHAGEVTVYELTPLAKDDPIRRFMEMNRPGEIDAQTGELKIFPDEIDTARRTVEELISSALVKGRKSLAAPAAPLTRTKLART